MFEERKFTMRIIRSQPSSTLRRILSTRIHNVGCFSFSTTSSEAKQKQKQRPLFVAATKQHVGKTTTCLALLSGLQKRFDTVGYFKPVGQQHVQVDVDEDDGDNADDDSDGTIRVDKDVVLIKEHFHLDHIDYRYMSPVIIPNGYTKRYVDGEISTLDQQREVEEAMEHISSRSDVTLIEGTGHCAVGSIVGLNNAKVANLLGADMILV
ncbi:MAG: dethiobiotin synthetase [Bacillariaceae sp.]